MATIAGASGVRAWLQARHLTWLTPQRMRVATIALFIAGTLGSSVVLSGSSSTRRLSAAPPARAVTAPAHFGDSLPAPGAPSH
jgi:hypothetical protein